MQQLPGASTPDIGTAPRKQYVPEQVSNPVALGVSPGGEVLVERDSTSFELIRPPGRQYIPDVLENAVLPLPPSVPAPFIPPQFPTFRPTRQSSSVAPDILENAILPVGGGDPAPFLTTSVDQSTTDKQYIPEQALNPLVPGAGAQIAPLIPTSVIESTTDKQYIPDQVTNENLLLSGAAIVIREAFFVRAKPPAQYIPDVLFNPVALNTPPPAPVKYGQSAQDQLFPKKQYIPDVLSNPVAPSSGPPPITPAFIEQPTPKKQYIPDQVINTLPASVPIGTELLGVDRYTLPVFPPGKQYFPDILINPVALALGGAPPAPFNPGLNEQPRAARQYVPDVLSNPVALASGAAAPFQSFVFPEFPARKQFLAEQLANPIVPGSSARLVPFTPAFIEQPRAARQYIPEVIRNLLFPIIPPPPIIPPVIPPVIPPPPPKPPVIPPPTQASSRTVTSVSIPYLQVVMDLEPAFEHDKHHEIQYPFSEAGHRARDFYADPYRSGAYAPPKPGSPTDITVPVITGGAFVGSVLTASNGTWTGSPTAFIYRWFANGAPITGATSQTFLLNVGTNSKVITVGVMAINGFGTSAEAISLPTAMVRPGGLITTPDGGLTEGPGGGLIES